MNSRWRVVPAAAVGFVAGLVLGYCELMIRYHETALGLGQFPFLLASRGLLGGAIGVWSAMRERISFGAAVAVAIGVIGFAEAANWILFGRG